MPDRLIANMALLAPELVSATVAPLTLSEGALMMVPLADSVVPPASCAPTSPLSMRLKLSLPVRPGLVATARDRLVWPGAIVAVPEIAW